MQSMSSCIVGTILGLIISWILTLVASSSIAIILCGQYILITTEFYFEKNYKNKVIYI